MATTGQGACLIKLGNMSPEAEALLAKMLSADPTALAVTRKPARKVVTSSAGPAAGKAKKDQKIVEPPRLKPGCFMGKEIWIVERVIGDGNQWQFLCAYQTEAFADAGLKLVSAKCRKRIVLVYGNSLPDEPTTEASESELPAALVDESPSGQQSFEV